MKPKSRNRKYPNDPEQRCELDPFCAYAGVHGTASQTRTTCSVSPMAASPIGSGLRRSRWLPPERLKNCPAEYQRVKTALQNTIMPFIDEEQMKKVQAKSWFTGEESRSAELDGIGRHVLCLINDMSVLNATADPAIELETRPKTSDE